LDGVTVERSVELFVSPRRQRTQLLENRPNPFNPATTLRFEAGMPGRYVLSILDVAGKKVQEFSIYAAGGDLIEQRWMGLDQSGQAVASGVYYVKLSAPDGELSQRITLLK
jgi:hypothetical protein